MPDIPASVKAFERSLSGIINGIESSQGKYRNAHRKYQQLRKDGSGVEGLYVTEYVAHNGAGFEIVLEREVDGNLWRKWIDYGVAGRSQDWFMVKANE